MADQTVRCSERWAVPLVSGSIPDILRKDLTRVDLTAGDKIARLRLRALLHQHPSWEAWRLQGDIAVPVRGGTAPLKTSPVPLRTWVHHHAYPSTLTAATDPKSDWGRDVARLARGLRDAMATTDNFERLNELALRQRPPRITANGKIEFGGGAELFIDSLPPDVSRALRESGRWFEYAVAGALLDHKLDEILMNLHLNTPVDGSGMSSTSDELDVVTRQGGSYVYWSCKTASRRNLWSYAEEARGQAARLIGPERVAVLVVPTVEDIPVPHGLRRLTTHHLWDGHRLHVIDAAFLAGGDVRDLAAASLPGPA